MTEQLIPMWRARYDGGSLTQLVNQVSLYKLQDYLHDSPKIAVMHNADDVIPARATSASSAGPSANA